jgi:hypothetical protein
MVYGCATASSSLAPSTTSIILLGLIDLTILMTHMMDDGPNDPTQVVSAQPFYTLKLGVLCPSSGVCLLSPCVKQQQSLLMP